jgi:hypothetical protein
MCDVGFFAGAPIGFVFCERVATASDDVCHRSTEAQTDISDATFATGVFTGIVEERTDGFFFGRAVLERYAQDTEQMRNVGDFGRFALLMGMDVGRVGECGIEQW